MKYNNITVEQCMKLIEQYQHAYNSNDEDAIAQTHKDMMCFNIESV